jgi:hypothetical protein
VGGGKGTDQLPHELSVGGVLARRLCPISSDVDRNYRQEETSMSHLRSLSPTRRLGLALLAFAACGSAYAEENPFGPIHVAANRSQYTGSGCPIQIIYTATVNFAMPHPEGLAFNYHWERSDGAKTAVQVVKPSANPRSMVLGYTWQLGAKGEHYDASVTLFVNSGNTHLSESSPSVSVTCK